MQFVGWDREIAPVTKDAVYTAAYADTDRGYRVTWKNDDGTILRTDKSVPYGTVPSYDGEPSKEPAGGYTYTFEGWEPEIAAVTGDAAYTAQVGYYCLDGSGSTWTKGSDEPLSFTFKRTVDDDTTLEHFTGLAIDGAAVAEKDAFGNANYAATSGSAIIALQPAYVEALSTGEHTLTISFDDGEAQATFTVANNPSRRPSSIRITRRPTRTTSSKTRLSP